ncbi:MAG: TonB-dependent receptor [Chitinophagales bacterium]|nr:TonB-dependent receptor [Chitinophagales bacterium]
MAQGQKDSMAIQKINKIKISAYRTKNNVSYIPAPVQVIDQETIQRSGLSRLGEILREHSGLMTYSDFGVREAVQIQGMDAEYVAILIDGQPLIGKTVGSIDLSRISLQNVEKIEIIKGSSSSLHLSEALGGTINIITKKPDHKDKIAADGLYKLASFMTHDASANLQWVKGKAVFDLFGNFYSTQGYNLIEANTIPTVQPYYNATIQPRFKYLANEKLDFSMSSKYFYQNQNNNQWAAQENVSGQIKTNEWSHTAQVNYFIDTNFKITADMLYATFDVSEQLTGQVNLSDTSFYSQFILRPDIRAAYSFSDKKITLGLGSNIEGLSRSLFDRQANNNYHFIYGQFENLRPSKFTYALGFRLDMHERFSPQFNPKLGMTYHVSPNYSFKFSIGFGYKTPDLRQLYYNFSSSNIGYTVVGSLVAAEVLDQLQAQGQIASVFQLPTKDLQPEKSININLGGEAKRDRFSLKYNFFYNYITNLIEYRGIATKTNGNSVFSYFNIDRIYTYGAELLGNFRVSDQFNISLNYQYLQARDFGIEDLVASGNAFAKDEQNVSFRLAASDYIGLFNRSNHIVNFAIRYDIPKSKTSLNYRMIYRSEFGIFDTNGNGFLDKYDRKVSGFFTHNLTATQEILKNLKAQVGVVNALNYTDADFMPQMSPRQFFLTLMYHL